MKANLLQEKLARSLDKANTKEAKTRPGKKALALRSAPLSDELANALAQAANEDGRRW